MAAASGPRQTYKSEGIPPHGFCHWIPARDRPDLFAELKAPNLRFVDWAMTSSTDDHCPSQAARRLGVSPAPGLR
jgi:hypothetical protein